MSEVLFFIQFYLDVITPVSDDSFVFLNVMRVHFSSCIIAIVLLDIKLLFVQFSSVLLVHSISNCYHQAFFLYVTLLLSHMIYIMAKCHNRGFICNYTVQ